MDPGRHSMTDRRAPGALGAGLLAVFLALMACRLAAAQASPDAAGTGEGLFEVRGIAVDVTAATAAAAREQALAKGARDAFWQIIDRLTLSSDRSKIGKVSDDEIETMIKDFSVADEKYSSVRYIATLNYTFKEDEVRRLLAQKGVPYAVTRAKTIVLLPVLRTEDALLLWQEPNPWLAAWRTLPSGQLVPVMVPLGDVGDVQIIDAEEAAVGDQERLHQIGARYGAADALVAFAVLNSAGASGTAELAVALTLYGTDGARKGPTRRYRAAEGESTEDLLTRAAEATMTEVQNQWKRENLVIAGQAAVESVRVPIKSPADWLAIRRRLEQVETIERIDIVLLSRSHALVNIHHYGTTEQLGLALEQADLILRQGADGLELTARSPS
jgi:hypothetical protein